MRDASLQILTIVLLLAPCRLAMPIVNAMVSSRGVSSSMLVEA
jgi:hypothetical protein